MHCPALVRVVAVGVGGGGVLILKFSIGTSRVALPVDTVEAVALVHVWAHASAVFPAGASASLLCDSVYACSHLWRVPCGVQQRVAMSQGRDESVSLGPSSRTAWGQGAKGGVATSSSASRDAGNR